MGAARPGPIIAVLAATMLVAVMSLDAKGIAIVGRIPSGLPTPGVPPVSVEDLRALIIPAAGIAIVTFTDGVLTARAFAARRGQEVNANAELRAVGACNIAAGLTHGFPVSSSSSRTALADVVGGRTQLYSLIALGLVVIVMVFASGLLAMFPIAALGALVVYAALRLIDLSEFRRLARFRRSELMLALATTAAVLGLGCSMESSPRLPCPSSNCFVGSHIRMTAFSGSCRALPACTTSMTIRRPSACPGWWCIAMTRRCASPMPKTSAGEH